MILLGEGAGLLLTAVWLFALIDVIQSDSGAIRNLPKATWVMIVLFTLEIGAIAWFVAGRPEASPRGGYSGGVGRNRSTQAYPEYNRAGRYAAGRPDTDDEFLEQVRRRAEIQREREARQRQSERDRLRGHVRDTPSDGS